jgi:ferredoxin--NADP+ reductase
LSISDVSNSGRNEETGNHVISMIGAKSKELIIYEDKMYGVNDEPWITTEDYGSRGRRDS